MNVERMQDVIEDAMSLVDPDDLPLGVEIVNVQSFHDAGILTSDAGVIVRLADGSEFQITVVQSRTARR